MSDAAGVAQPGERIALLKVLGPIHVWALGVGIVLVGEFMGWNFSVAKGGAYGSLIACWIIGLLYTCVAMIDSEVTSTVAAAGGQYTQAKHIIGPLMAFNVGLYLVMAYTMLEAADALVVGDLIKAVAADSGYANFDSRPFTLVTIAFLALLNYRGVFVTLTVNFVITAVAFVAIVVLFLGVAPWHPGQTLIHQELLTQLPYGWLGVVAALQFGMWYYLGIEGTCQAAEEVRSAGRSIPLGTMCGMITLLIAAAMTWYVATGLMPWEYLGQAVTPLYDAARLSGSKGLQTLLFVGTLFSAVASANGCINDASRAWFSMSRDRYMPEWFGAVHPRYRTPYRAIMFLVPIAISFAFTGLLDQVITFSILSGLLGYTFMSINIVKFRRQWPLGSINRGYIHPFHPIPAIVLAVLCIATYFATYLGYGTSLLSIMAFYIMASIWFALHRYKYVKRGDQFTMDWPRPKRY
ncbi:amino acid permease [Paraburkholderia sp. LEh10]|jgi:ethanolamine permease|uniref:APC family permease n=1 Tax=Paraburkholderia sp. LEh10 TaxID=2821353 RepID=UPI001AE993D9|nr:amino acid permease [Paraburkholderia sp. LEh10]MBP0588450.1 amino acid permease [Paraburkholderia sp. LEh10]